VPHASTGRAAQGRWVFRPELLTERSVSVDHVTIYRWVQRFTPEFIEAARPRRHAPRDRWFVDETYVKVGGQWRYVYRAVDQFRQVVDVYVSRRRDGVAARRFFDHALGSTAVRPAEVTTDKAPAYLRVRAAFDQLALAI
jgi:IS6 family transposase